MLTRGGNDTGDRPATVGEAIDAYAAELRSRRGRPSNATRLRFHLTPSDTAMTA